MHSEFIYPSLREFLTLLSLNSHSVLSRLLKHLVKCLLDLHLSVFSEFQPLFVIGVSIGAILSSSIQVIKYLGYDACYRAITVVLR